MLSSDELQVEGGFLSGAASGLEKAKLKNARMLSPLWHGEGCVGLSGLYAIVNAIRLTLAHKHSFTGPELHALMTAGLRFMSGRLTPEQVALCGLRVTLWRGLAEAMVEATRRVTRAPLQLERLFPTDLGREAAFAAIEQAIARVRVPMMLCRGGRYTVVSGFTGSSLLLFDSGGACWMTRRLCGVPGDCDGARHIIYPTSLLALTV